MHQEAIKASFDRIAESYDNQTAKFAPIIESLHYVMGGILSKFPQNAKILCVGAGTGAEIIYLAKRFPDWRFMAVDPSESMLEVCRRQLRNLDMEERCEFHAGYLSTLSSAIQYDAATSILVSQFITDKEERTDFFREIASRLKSGGLLICSDLSSELGSTEYESLLNIWIELLKAGGTPSQNLEDLRTIYGKDVSILPSKEIAGMMTTAGFENPTLFYQAALIHGWFGVKEQLNLA